MAKNKNIKTDDLADLLMEDRLLDKLMARLTVSLTPILASALPPILAPILTPIFDQLLNDFAKKFSLTVEKMIDQSSAKILNTHIKPLTTEVHTLSEENKALKLKIDVVENQLRLDSLVIQGLPDSTYAEAASGLGPSLDQSDSVAAAASLQSHVDTEKTVLGYVNDRLGLHVSPADIKSAYRIPSSKNSGPRPIIVQFATRRVRDSIFRARRSFKSDHQSHEKPVYINEHLTKYNADLFARARAMVKNKKFAKAWTAGGLVYIRKSEQPGEKSLRVTCPSDLE